MKKDNNNLIIFLERNFIQIYTSGKIVNLNLPANLLSDLEVVDRENMKVFITSFISKNILEKGRATLLVSASVSITKDLPNKDGKNQEVLEKEIKDFEDVVPFTEIISKTYNLKDGVKAVTVNKELVDTIYDSFIQNGFYIDMTLPLEVFENYKSKNQLDMSLVEYIIANRDKLTKFNMLLANEGPSIFASGKDGEKKQTFLPYLIGAFVLLLVVLVIFLLIRR